MKRTRGRDTAPEIRLRSLLHRRGLRFRVDVPIADLGSRRRVDVVFPSSKVAVFVDGCFWHGCPEHATWPRSNAAFWRSKIERNQRRDEDTTRRLQDAGWLVLRFWEHEPPERAADAVERAVRRG